ncbi:hypothetical protein HPB47_001903 [Ixodes persulcatus]|uniref:Uncharacterized protein n=1 Tax=Ixodes persulcatus TaxID=34615 RepID=A0AC60PMR7_IXOPE|nr:hypothetical protein HPB47_001903 [Ixodes persulcatus]
MTKNETETRKKRGTSSAIARCHDEVKLGATESGASAKPRGSGRGRPPALHPTEDEARERTDRSLRGRRLPIPDEASERPREPSAVSDADRARTEPSPIPGATIVHEGSGDLVVPPQIGVWLTTGAISWGLVVLNAYPRWRAREMRPVFAGVARTARGSGVRKAVPNDVALIMTSP